MHESNISRNISGHFAATMRRYAVYSLVMLLNQLSSRRRLSCIRETTPAAFPNIFLKLRRPQSSGFSSILPLHNRAELGKEQLSQKLPCPFVFGKGKSSRRRGCLSRIAPYPRHGCRDFKLIFTILPLSADSRSVRQPGAPLSAIRLSVSFIARPAHYA
jgi:hypothetical protein